MMVSSGQVASFNNRIMLDSCENVLLGGSANRLRGEFNATPTLTLYKTLIKLGMLQCHMEGLAERSL